MPKGGGRTEAERRFKAAQTDHEIKSLVGTELDSVRKKTSRLREQRLAKEEASGISRNAKKPAKKRTPKQR